MIRLFSIRAFVWIAVITAIVLMWGCSPQKNTAASRQYQAFITRYNVYFNGDEHYKETLADMEKNYEDDYSSLLFMHPAEARLNEKAPQPTADFTRSIEKAQKAIQLRSIKKRPARKSGKADPDYKAWLKREEYNPFLHNAWMMMGRSQYFNGDFLGAASTFMYVAKHFSWLPATVTEARLWEARSYCSMGWIFEAETIIKRIKADALTNNTLKWLYNFTYADIYIHNQQFEEALPYLDAAISFSKGDQKTRLTFLQGQLLQRLGRRQEAYAAFSKAGSASSASYRTKFNARIKQSEVYEGADIEPEVKALRRMTHYDRNAEYLDQLYYAIGNLYLSRRDTTHAIENYELAIEKSRRNGIDKAIAALTLGAIYFDRHRYDLAQKCYSEGVGMISEEYPDYDLIQRRSAVLDELAVYAENVTLQDSLLRLSAMTPEQQREVIDKIISDLNKKEREEAEAARREEYLAQAAAAGNGLTNNSQSAAPTTFTRNDDKSWYFYNTATKNAGKTEFQKRWGSRKLEDDWRRRNKASFSFNDFDTDSDVENPESVELIDSVDERSAEELERESDPHFPEYYLKQIPATDADRAISHEIIQEGLYNMGLILKDKLEDFPSSVSEFSRLLTLYPDNIYRLETYYNLYLMAIRSGNKVEAEKWRRLIIDDFPESNYGVAMTDPNYFENLRRMEQTQEQLYAATYDDYLNDRNDRVHQALKQMQSDFPMSKLMSKFMFLDALSYVTENRPDDFKESLRSLLEQYPSTDMTDLAAAWLQGLARGRKLHSGTSNMRGMVWNMRLSNDSTFTDVPIEEIEFDLSPDQPQQLVLLYPVDAVSPNQLLYDVARHNFSTYAVRDFDLEQMNFGNLGILVIKEFANEKQLEHYRALLESDADLSLPSSVIPVSISVANFNEMLRKGASFEQYFDAIGDTRLRQLHEHVLPSDEYPSAEEMYATPEGDDSLSEGSEVPDDKADDIKVIEDPSKNPELTSKSDPVVSAPIVAPAVSDPTPVEVPATPSPAIPEGSEGDDPLNDFDF